MSALPIKLLDRLILLDLLPKLLGSIAVFSAVFLVTGPVLAASRFQALGFPWWVIAQFVGWDFTQFVRYTFPMGMLLAALLGFDRLSRDSEVVALFAGGISFLRIIVPVVGLGLAVSLVNYVFNDRIATYANARVADFNNHRQDIIGETTRPLDLADRPDGKLQVTVHIEKGYDVLAKTLRQVTITVYGPDGVPRQTIYADRAKPHGSGLKTWTLFNEQSTDLATGLKIENSQIDTFQINKTPENMTFLQRDPETLTFRDLQRQINELKAGGGDSSDIRNAEVGLWFKVSLPFSCLIFGMVGAPLGLRSPRSGKVSGLVWALPIMLGYYVIYMTMSNVATGGAVPPILAAWLPNIIGLVVGAGLIWKASR
jgi:lipopolysaccharide export system permease protein